MSECKADRFLFKFMLLFSLFHHEKTIILIKANLFNSLGASFCFVSNGGRLGSIIYHIYPV